MRVGIVLSFMAAVASVHAYNYNYEAMARRAMTTTAPATSTTQTPDSWECATSNMTQYFDVPKPTGTLLSAIGSFGDSLIAPCMKTAKGTQVFSCTISNSAAWCPFSTKAAAIVTAAYSSYARKAAVWWNAKSSAIGDARRDCPVTWGKFGEIDNAWLNLTIAHAACYLKVSPIVSNGVTSTTNVDGTKSTASATSKAATTSSKAKRS